MGNSYKHYIVIALNAVSVVGTVIILILIVRLNIKTDLDLRTNHASSYAELQQIKEQESRQTNALKCVLTLFGADRQAVVTGAQIDKCVQVEAVTPTSPTNSTLSPSTGTAAAPSKQSSSTGSIEPTVTTPTQHTSTDQTKQVTTSAPPPAMPSFSLLELIRRGTDSLLNIIP